ncbi:9784_t:CDS:2 [Acaulospora colombiana]|uniref:9784_t:CDS:1 n=1 Tax=Acaulospora colombiana TaxID=27376 RepID=A0ACA9LDN3_9GLOM|nr:9784_t:CDS:2 [Acaulospora colombiana]
MWFYIQPTEYDSPEDPEKSGKPNNSQESATKKDFFLVFRAKVSQAAGILKKKCSRTATKDVRNVKIGDFDGSNRSHDSKGLRFLTTKSRGRSKCSMIGRCGSSNNKTDFQSSDIILIDQEYSVNRNDAIPTMVNKESKFTSSDVKKQSFQVDTSAKNIGEKSPKSYRNNFQDTRRLFRNSKAGIHRSRGRDQTNINSKQFEVDPSAYLDKSSGEKKNVFTQTTLNVAAIKDVQTRISDAIHKNRLMQNNEYTAFREDTELPESPSSLQNSFREVNQVRKEYDAQLVSHLERQVELDANLEFSVKTIKEDMAGINTSGKFGFRTDENERNDNVVAETVFDIPNATKEVITFSSLEADVEFSSRQRIARDFEILKLLEKKHRVDQETEESIKQALEVLKFQSKSRVGCTRKLKSPKRMEEEVDDVHKKFQYLDSWRSSMVERLEDLKANFDELEDLITNGRQWE